MYRAPPDAENAKATLCRRGFAKTTEKVRPQSSTAITQNFQLPKLDSAHVDLDTLEEMSFWRLSLTRRIRRAQIRFMYADTEVADLHDLAREVADFRKCCRALTWRQEAAA
jgi:hypothetical protein